MKQPLAFLYFLLCFLCLTQCSSNQTQDDFDSGNGKSSENLEATNSKNGQNKTTTGILQSSLGVCPRTLVYSGKFRKQAPEWEKLKNLNDIFQERSCSQIAESLGIFPSRYEHFVLQLQDFSLSRTENAVEVRKEGVDTYIYLTFNPEYWLRNERYPDQEMAYYAIKGYLAARSLRQKIPAFLQEGLMLYGANKGTLLTQSFFAQVLHSEKNISQLLNKNPESYNSLQNYLLFLFIKEKYGGTTKVKKFIESLEIEENWTTSLEEITQISSSAFFEKLYQFQITHLNAQVKEQKSFSEFRGAMKLVLQKNYKEAISLFQKLLSKYPFPYIQGNVAFHLGLSHYFDENYLAAEKQFKEVLQNHSFTTLYLDETSFSYALCALKLNQTKKGLARLDTFLNYFPDSSKYMNGWYWKGVASLKQKQEEKAETCFKRFIDVPRHPLRNKALEQLASLKKKQGKLQAAAKYYQEISRTNPNFESPYLELNQPLSSNEKRHVLKWLKGVHQKENQTKLIEMGKRVAPLVSKHLLTAPIEKKQDILVVLAGLELGHPEISALWSLLPKLPSKTQKQLFSQFIVNHHVALSEVKDRLKSLKEPLRTELSNHIQTLLFGATSDLLSQLPTLLLHLNSKDIGMRKAGIEQLIHLGALEGLPVITHFLKDPAEEIQIIALSGIAILGGKKATEPKLLPFLTSKNWKLVLASLRALNTIYLRKSSRGAIQNLLEHPKMEIRIEATKILGNQNSRICLYMIYPQIVDPNMEIAQITEEIFLKVPPKYSIPVLIEGLKEKKSSKLILKTTYLLRRVTRISSVFFEKDNNQDLEKMKKYWLAWWTKNQNRFKPKKNN